MTMVIQKTMLPKVDVYLDLMQRTIIGQLGKGVTEVKISRMALGKLAYTLINETGIITYAVVEPD